MAILKYMENQPKFELLDRFSIADGIPGRWPLQKGLGVQNITQFVCLSI